MNYLLLVPPFLCAFAVEGLGLWGIVYGIHLVRQHKLWKRLCSALVFMGSIGSIGIGAGILFITFFIY